MNLAVFHPKLPFDQRAHSFDRPQWGIEPLSGRAFEQGQLQLSQCFGIQSGRTPTLAHVAQRVYSPGFEHIAPAVDRLPGRIDHTGHLRWRMSGLKQAACTHAPLHRFFQFVLCLHL
jgi:hypothetical protein